LSDEPFWPKLFSTFRLRAAFGKSGQQPDQFAALQSFEAIPGPTGGPGVRPQFIGNPKLGPERGREIEAGIEAALFRDRVGLDLTVFDKRTEDAIVARTVAPSGGFPGIQFVNAGSISNKGIELQVTGTPVSRQNLKVDLSLSVSHTVNKILDMGGVSDLAAGANQFHRVGFPVASFFAKKVLSADLDASGQPTNIMCDAGDGNSHPTGQAVSCDAAPTVFIGQPLPKWEGSFNATIQVGQRLTLSGLADFKTGGYNFNADIAIQCSVLRLCLPNVNPAADVLFAADELVQLLGVSTIPEVRYLKIRSVSASYRVPERWAHWVGGNTATVTLTAHNLHTFSNFQRGPDPELGSVYNLSAAFGQHNQESFQGIPLPFQFLATIRVTF
jgi:outer membrane receptor protein involved in Fe transport